MYTYANYSRPNSIVQAKLDNYKLNNNINLEKNDFIIYSYQEILKKHLRPWHMKYIYCKNKFFLVLRLLDNKNYKLMILPPLNKFKFIEYLFSNLGIENSGLVDLD